MADEFSAGSIAVELRAEFENLATGLVQVQQKLSTFSEGVQKSAKQFESVGSTVSRSFDDMQKRTDRASVSFLRASSSLLGVQIALQTLITGNGNVGAMKEGLQGLANGFSTAAAAMHVFQGNISLLGAGIIGVAVAAISIFTRHFEEMIKLTDENIDATIRSQKSINAYANALKDADEKAIAFKQTLSQGLTAALHISEAAFSSNQKKLRELPEEMDKIRLQIAKEAGGSISDAEMGRFADPLTRQDIFHRNKTVLDVDVITKLIEKLGTLKSEMENLTKQQGTITATAPWDEANLAVVKLNEELQKTRTALSDVEETGRASLELGVARPAEVAARNLQAAKKVLDEILEDNQKIRAEAQSGRVPIDKVESFLKDRLHPDEDIGAARDKVLSAQSRKDSIKAAGDYASGLSRSIGDAVSQGILNGEKAMQILANVGQNLFGNFLQKSVDQFEKGMVKAFESIGGAGGEILGAALTGVLGVVGGILSKKKGGTQNFAQIQSGITSSEAVRGIVAGPSSVAIAAVGEDLQRANQPVVTELQEIARILRSIAGKSGGGGAAGGLPWPVIPTA